jgi:hypothetical protein
MDRNDMGRLDKFHVLKFLLFSLESGGFSYTVAWTFFMEAYVEINKLQV